MAPGFAADYVAGFNAAVATGDYAPLTAWYSEDAVLRFENVPPEAACPPHPLC